MEQNPLSRYEFFGSDEMMLTAEPTQKTTPKKRVVFAEKKNDSKAVIVRTQPPPKSPVPERPKNPRPPNVTQNERKINYPPKGENGKLFEKKLLFQVFKWRTILIITVSKVGILNFCS